MLSEDEEIEKEKVLDWLNMEFDSDLGGYVSDDTNLPLSLFYDDEEDELCLLDQTKLPYETRMWRTDDWQKGAEVGIKGMVTRGSQAIGVTAAYCMLLAAADSRDSTKKDSVDKILKAGKKIRKARPTAANLSWAVDRMSDAAKNALKTAGDVYDQVKVAADRIFIEDIFISRALAENGIRLIEDGETILTHCNAGSLATSYGGSALGVVEYAVSSGKDVTVVSKETRPRSQGYKLTLWELSTAGIPAVAVTDNMVSSSFEKFGIDRVLVGADRITKDGCVANKVGTKDIARMVAFNQVPFVVAASFSTLDLEHEGDDVPIEEREVDEIYLPYHYEALEKKKQGIVSEEALDFWPPEDMLADEPEPGKITLFNPAFDVTSSRLISNIVLDIGIFRPERISTLDQEKLEAGVSKIVKRFSEKI